MVKVKSLISILLAVLFPFSLQKTFATETKKLQKRKNYENEKITEVTASVCLIYTGYGGYNASEIC